MGCAASKKVDATTPYLYRPPPSGFAVFDINAIEEPWLNKLDNNIAQLDNNQQKPSHVPTPLLEKLDTLENEPRTWEEVSKALEDDLKKPPAAVEPKPGPKPGPSPAQQQPKKSFSFHTVAELDVKKDESEDKNKQLVIRLKKTESMPGSTRNESMTGSTRSELMSESTRSESTPIRGADSGGSGKLKANPFILKDRMEREKEGKEAVFDKIMKSKRDPLMDFPEKYPPGGSHLVVLYTTTLGGVRRTFEDCNRVRAILENHRVVFDERDVSLHGGFLAELRGVVGEEVAVPVPRLFVKGRYLGGVDEVVELNESGRLGRILSSARVERGLGWLGCEGCGGARFVPCLECGGSCKVVVGDSKERCPKCNENGLAHCPLCH